MANRICERCLFWTAPADKYIGLCEPFGQYVPSNHTCTHYIARQPIAPPAPFKTAPGLSTYAGGLMVTRCGGCLSINVIGSVCQDCGAHLI